MEIPISINVRWSLYPVANELVNKCCNKIKKNFLKKYIKKAFLIFQTKKKNWKVYVKVKIKNLEIIHVIAVGRANFEVYSGLILLSSLPCLKKKKKKLINRLPDI